MGNQTVIGTQSGKLGSIFGLYLLCSRAFAETRVIGDQTLTTFSFENLQAETNSISAQVELDCYQLSKGIVSMRTKLANWTRMAVVVVAIAGTQSGCKSGWKMPGTDMFPWSKKPTESSLAGSSPSLSMPSNSSSSVGPAFKNSPSPLVSNAANPNRPTSPYGATTGPSFNMPPNNAMAKQMSPGQMPNSQMGGSGSGISAGANGYQTGQYNMAGTTNRSGGMTAPTGYGAPSQSSNGFPSTPPQNSMAGLPPSMPPAYGGMQTGMPPGMPAAMPQSPSISSYPPMGNAGGVPAMSAAYNAGAVNPMQSQSSMPNAVPGSYQPSSLPPSPGAGPSTAQIYTGATPYRPGSVGRQTAYDFSNQATGGAGMPPTNVPNTANGLPSGQPNTMYR
jgi:hypothetical protein